MGRQPEESMKSKAWSGAYAPETTEAVYAELLRAAEMILQSGRPVVIDASFRTRALREAAREIATSRGVPFLFVECAAPREVILRRLMKRDTRGTHESDARADLLDEFEKRFEPIDELPPSQHIRLDTSQPAEETRARLSQIFES
jgi:predicted kinase